MRGQLTPHRDLTFRSRRDLYWRATIAQAGSSRGRLLPDGLATALDGVQPLQALKVYGASDYA
jgi:hypothetical protein